MHSFYVISLLSIVALCWRTEGNLASQYSPMTSHFGSLGTLKSCVDSENYDHIVIVDPEYDDQTCNTSERAGNSAVHCKTLDYALEQFQDFHSVMFFLASLNDTYFLNTTHRVIGRRGFALCGNNETGLFSTIQCGSHDGKNNSGLFFNGSNDITISNVQFLYCGSEQNSTSKNGSSFVTIRAGIYIYKCTNVTMEHTQVLNGTQAIGLVMYDTDGVVKLSKCTFASNRVDESTKQHGGGGAAIEFTYSTLDDVGSNGHTYAIASKKKQIKESKYSIENCTFAMNRAYYSSSDMALDNVALYRAFGHNTIGKGGGLSIAIKGDAEGNAFKVDGCHFVKNSGLWGGGLHIGMTDNSTNNEVLLTGNTFESNTAHINNKRRGTGGGGIDIYNHVYYDADNHGERSRVHISDSTFFKNSALDGGALYVAIVPENVPTIDRLTEVIVSNSSFHGNVARLGAAVVVTVVPIFTGGFLTEVQFHDCNFSSS